GARLPLQPGGLRLGRQEIRAERDRPGLLQRLAGERRQRVARHVGAVEGRRAQRTRADDRASAQDQKGQVMQILIAIALKSLLIAGLTLGALELMKRRSAAERSWIAHIGLLALLILACAP